MTRVIACVCLLLSMVGCARVIPPGPGALCPFSSVKLKKVNPVRPDPPPPTRMGAIEGRNRDFSGHGPTITIDVELCISNDSTDCVSEGENGDEIIAFIDFLAEEKNSDGSRAADGTRIWQRFIRTVRDSDPETGMIASIDSPTTAQIVVRSPPAGSESLPCSDGDLITIELEGGPVRSIELIGDTPGKDVSKDENCRCDTRVNDLVFNEVAVTPVGRAILEPPDLEPTESITVPDRESDPTSVPDGPVDPVDWRIGAWTACADGTRTRSVSCVALRTGTMVDDARCLATAGSRPPGSEPCGGTMAGSCYFVGPAPTGSGIVSTCLLRDPDSRGSRELVECRPSWCEGNTLNWYTCGPVAGSYVFGDRAMADTLACSSAGCGPASGFLSGDAVRPATMQSGYACVE